MSDRREQILETARRLFGERGYDGVSMRDIAKELGFSVGNVTHYFKKKEELVEAAILEQSKSYHLPATPTDLAELNRLFQYICQGILDRRYYFRHYDQMAHVSQRIYELQRSIEKDLYLALSIAFENLQKNGDMEPERYPDQGRYFVRGLMIAMTYWIPQKAVLGQEQEGAAADFMMCIWALVYPRLTEKGKKTFHAKIDREIKHVMKRGLRECEK